MDDKENAGACLTDQSPTVLVGIVFRLLDMEGIVERFRGLLEGDVMLASIARGLGIVPFEAVISHGTGYPYWCPFGAALGAGFVERDDVAGLLAF